MSGEKGAMVEKCANDCKNIDFQENLCATSCSGLQHIMSVVVKLVNFIRLKVIGHMQFQHLLSELRSKYSDVACYSEVHWLSR
jgi:hypothetical protein